ncbi:MAG TPA: trypsin-like peptidase domain-containing protein [Bradyrhizobium sp.]|uniref:S1C family serine protease n=1 Tax=Bradyrhizobium sp. TaxID=376 RepID=UPI002CD4D585|nr:trypsin-like peptidase domain-containing protein [Bradyrhizobium sp.]HLZ04190.1 trypsin-like peptidase domain-containing protein [Bradyrhizobium sp.]
MRKLLFLACLVQMAITSVANAAGPYGNIHVGNWTGGAFTNDSNGAFSHCGATASYGNGVILVVGQNVSNSWLLGFASPAFHLNKGASVPIDVTFDGQTQARLFATATSGIMATAILPPNVAHAFQKASLMVAVSGGTVLNFNLTSTGPLLAVLAQCVRTVKAGGIKSAGEFTVPKVVAAKAETPSAKSARTGTQTGTGFVVSASGHIVTNHHVIDGCIGDIKGNLTGEAAATLRVVNSDEFNDLALLQGPAESFKAHVRIRDRAMHSGDSVVAIGYLYHGLLTSDFTVTTGIVSSLSGMLNDTRFLQISAAVQPGNSGGPLFDTSGDVVGVVSGKLDALKIARYTGSIPENINFAIKTGALRDFLDNSVVAYETAAPGTELKTADIAGSARAYTLLISCKASEPAETARR